METNNLVPIENSIIVNNLSIQGETSFRPYTNCDFDLGTYSEEYIQNLSKQLVNYWEKNGFPEKIKLHKKRFQNSKIMTLQSSLRTNVNSYVIELKEKQKKQLEEIMKLLELEQKQNKKLGKYDKLKL